MHIKRNSITQNKPAIFDWLVFTISLLLGFIFPALKDFTAWASFYYWIFTALVLYVCGLWLKHRPVYYRLAVAGRQQKGMPFLIFLIIGHWIILLAVIIIAEVVFRSITGLPPISNPDPRSGLSILTAILTSACITWLAFRPGGKGSKRLPENYLFYRELAGDLLLISGVTILSFVFWEKSVMAIVAQMPQKSFADIFVMFICLSFAYMLFYLPLRYLYLVEDVAGKAWKRLLLIFILILIRGLWEALR